MSKHKVTKENTLFNYMFKKQKLNKADTNTSSSNKVSAENVMDSTSFPARTDIPADNVCIKTMDVMDVGRYVGLPTNMDNIKYRLLYDS